MSKAVTLRDHVADNMLKVTAVPLALVIYLILSGVYPLLSSVIVR